MATITVYNLYSESVESYTGQPVHLGTFNGVDQTNDWLARRECNTDKWWLKMERKVFPEHQRAGGTKVKDYTYFTIYEVEVTRT